MLIRASLLCGATTAAVAVAVMVLMYDAYDQFQLVWPMAYVPLFVTGVYAVSRSGSKIASGLSAAAAGAIGGLVAALLFDIGLIALVVAGPVLGNDYPPPWTLTTPLSASPFGWSARLFYSPGE